MDERGTTGADGGETKMPLVLASKITRRNLDEIEIEKREGNSSGGVGTMVFAWLLIAFSIVGFLRGALKVFEARAAAVDSKNLAAAERLQKRIDYGYDPSQRRKAK